MAPVSAAMVFTGVPREAAIGTTGNNAKAATKRPIPSLKRHPFVGDTPALMSDEVMILAPLLVQMGCLDEKIDIKRTPYRLK
jgi:hypothetical protein